MTKASTADIDEATLRRASKDAFTKEYASKKTAYVALPENIYLVDNPNHPTLGHLFDTRAGDKFDEDVVKTFMAIGCTTPIDCTRAPVPVDGWKEPPAGMPVCVYGRWRVINGREANRRIRLANPGKPDAELPLVLLPLTYDKDDADTQFVRLIVENLHRHEESDLQKAEKLVELLRRNQGNKRAAATVFRMSLSTVENYIKLHALPEVVKRAIRTGKISASGALELSGMDSGDAEKKLKELTNDGKERCSLGKVRRSVGKLKAPAKKELVSKLDSIAERVTPACRARMASFTFNNLEQSSPDFLAGILYGARWARGVK